MLIPKKLIKFDMKLFVNFKKIIDQIYLLKIFSYDDF